MNELLSVIGLLGLPLGLIVVVVVSLATRENRKGKE